MGSKQKQVTVRMKKINSSKRKTGRGMVKKEKIKLPTEDILNCGKCKETIRTVDEICKSADTLRQFLQKPLAHQAWSKEKQICIRCLSQYIMKNRFKGNVQEMCSRIPFKRVCDNCGASQKNLDHAIRHHELKHSKQKLFFHFSLPVIQETSPSSSRRLFVSAFPVRKKDNIQRKTVRKRTKRKFPSDDNGECFKKINLEGKLEFDNVNDLNKCAEESQVIIEINDLDGSTSSIDEKLNIKGEFRSHSISNSSYVSSKENSMFSESTCLRSHERSQQSKFDDNTELRKEIKAENKRKNENVNKEESKYDKTLPIENDIQVRTTEMNTEESEKEVYSKEGVLILSLKQLKNLTAEMDDSKSIAVESILPQQQNEIFTSDFPLDLRVNKNQNSNSEGNNAITVTMPVNYSMKSVDTPSNDSLPNLNGSTSVLPLPSVSENPIYSQSEVPVLACEWCFQYFTCRENLNEHLDNVHENKDFISTYLCYMCPKTYSNRKDFEHHKIMDIHKFEAIFICNICNKTFPSTQSLLEHRIYHVDSQLSCIFCSTIFKRKVELIKHIQKRHKCKECNNITTSRSHNHFNDKTYNCNFCLNSFNNSKELLLHSRKHIFRCDCCNFNCLLDFDLILHRNREHFSEDEKYFCTECSSYFFSLIDFENHQNVKHDAVVTINSSKSNINNINISDSISYSQNHVKSDTNKKINTKPIKKGNKINMKITNSKIQERDNSIRKKKKSLNVNKEIVTRKNEKNKEKSVTVDTIGKKNACPKTKVAAVAEKPITVTSITSEMSTELFQENSYSCQKCDRKFYNFLSFRIHNIQTHNNEIQNESIPKKSHHLGSNRDSNGIILSSNGQ